MPTWFLKIILVGLVDTPPPSWIGLSELKTVVIIKLLQRMLIHKVLDYWNCKLELFRVGWVGVGVGKHWVIMLS